MRWLPPHARATRRVRSPPLIYVIVAGVRLIWIAFLLALSTPARAETKEPTPPADSAEPAATAMTTYFKGEIAGGYTLIGMGVVGIAAGIPMWIRGGSTDEDTLRGASYPALGFGVLHLAAGIFVGVSSAKRMRAFGDTIRLDSDAWIDRETKRMVGVSRQFTVLEIIEVVGIGGGIAMVVIGAQQDRPLLTGIGLSLVVELGATLVFDIVAARRAKRYRAALGRIEF